MGDVIPPAQGALVVPEGVPHIPLAVLDGRSGVVGGVIPRLVVAHPDGPAIVGLLGEGVPLLEVRLLAPKVPVVESQDDFLTITAAIARKLPPYSAVNTLGAL